MKLNKPEQLELIALFKVLRNFLTDHNMTETDRALVFAMQTGVHELQGTPEPGMRAFQDITRDLGLSQQQVFEFVQKNLEALK